MYKLGQFFRDRYNLLLGVGYEPYKIYVQSSGYDRCIMSAQVFLAALFLPETEQDKWNRDILWQPVPVHNSIPKGTSGDSKCPALAALFEELQKNSKELHEFLEKYPGIFEEWSLKSGQDIKDILGAAYLYKFLVTKKQDGGE